MVAHGEMCTVHKISFLETVRGDAGSFERASAPDGGTTDFKLPTERSAVR